MAYERNWFFDPNVVYTPAVASDMTRYQLWRLAALLTGKTGATQGLWTVLGSSDSVASGMDGVDRWGATFDPAKLVFSAGGARSWIVLRSPVVVSGGQNRYTYLLLTCNVAAGSSVTMRVASAAPTGNGSTTTDPTFDGSVVSLFSSANINNATTAQIRFFGALSASGDFYFLGMRVGSGQVQFGVLGSSVVAPKANDIFPFYVSAAYAASASVLSNITAPSLLVTSTNPSHLPAATYTCGVLNPSFYGNGSSTNFGGTDNIDGTVPDFPFYVVTSPASLPSIRGRLPDLGVTPTGTIAPLGSVMRDALSNVEHVLFHNLIVPLNVVPDVS